MAIPVSSAVQVSEATPTLLFTPKPYACRITIFNVSSYDIYIGDDTVTSDTGLPIPPNGQFSLDSNEMGPVYAITTNTAQTTPYDTRIFIEPTN